MNKKSSASQATFGRAPKLSLLSLNKKTNELLFKKTARTCSLARQETEQQRTARPMVACQSKNIHTKLFFNHY